VNPYLTQAQHSRLDSGKAFRSEVQSEDAGLDANLLVDFTIILGKDFDGRYVRD